MSLQTSFRLVPDGFDKAMNRAFSQIHQEESTGRAAKKLSFALVLLVVLLAAALAVAGAIWGGVLHFSDDLTIDHESSALPEAQALVQTDLAHYEYGSVEMDVLQAICDGQELRIAYSLYDKTVTTAYPDNPWQTLEEMNLDGFLGSCDGGAIDGVDIYWENDRMIGTQTPGKVLFYKRANLIEPLSGDVTISLYMLQKSEEQPSFIMAIGDTPVKPGKAEPFEENGQKVELVRAAFTALRGTLEVRFSSGEEALNWGLYMQDGTALSGYMLSWDPDEAVQDILFLYDPPKEGWPERLVFKASDSEKMEVIIQ